MSVRTKDEIMKFIKDRTQDDTSDETLAFIEDVNDTFNDYDSKLNDSTDWKQKYEDNDKQWREKYRDRFFSGDDNNNDTDKHEPDEENEEPKTFTDLFTFSKTKPAK